MIAIKDKLKEYKTVETITKLYPIMVWQSLGVEYRVYKDLTLAVFTNNNKWLIDIKSFDVYKGDDCRAVMIEFDGNTLTYREDGIESLEYLHIGNSTALDKDIDKVLFRTHYKTKLNN